jgi:hypothetical protein
MSPTAAIPTAPEVWRRFAGMLPPVLWRWLVLLTATYVAVISLPVPLASYGTGLDPSWILGLNWAHSLGLVAGRDVVFTYGPLGYLLYPERVSGAPMLALLFRLGLYLLSVGALYRLVSILPSKVAAFWTAVILGMAVVLDALPAESQLVFGLERLALIALVDRSKWRYAELSVLGFLSGLGLLVKVNQGLEGVALFLAVLTTVVFQEWPLTRRARRLVFAVVCVLPLSILMMFLASTGSLLGLVPYARNTWQIVSGYSEGMGLPGPLWQAALACATIAVTFLAALLVAVDLRSLWPGMAPTLVVTLFVFKHSMVRQDPGHAPAFHMGFAVALLFLLICAKAARDRRLIVILQLFSVAMAYAVSAQTYPGFDSHVRARLVLRQAYASLADLWRWPSTWERIGASNDRQRGQLRLPDQFHRFIGNGTVDAVPWDVDIVQANGWEWRPRPVFQSYSAYTPALDRLNAGHLYGDRTSDFVLLNFASIDGRHPFLEAPLSWRALLDRYDLKLASADWFLLQHRKGPRFRQLASLGHSTARWDEEVRLPPAEGLLVMAPRIDLSLSGQAMSLLFRPAPVYMEAALRSGGRVRWRSVPRNLGGGFLIRPFPQDLRELRELFLPGLPPASPERIVSVSFRTSRPSEFAPEIPIEWSLLPVREGATGEIARRPFAQSSLTPLWRVGDPPPIPSNAQVRVRRNWIEVTPATDDPQLLFNIGPSLGRFRTLIVRAWFQKADRIDAFFGKQVDGRGVRGVVPVTGRWLDVYLGMSQNLYWEDEHGSSLRFDPVSSAGAGTAARIAGIWGSTEAGSAALPDVQFYPVPPADLPRSR